MNPNETKKFKITFIFFLIVLFFLVLIGAFIHIATSDKKLPRLKISETDKALRGDILSRNLFTIASSKKLYKAVVDTRCIDPGKRELFIELFSTFSTIDKEYIREKLSSKDGFVTITYKLDSKAARYEKQLGSKLFKLGVFRTYTDPKSGREFLHGLEIRESGEYRIYPLNDLLTPVIGYVKKYEKGGYTHIKGKYGLEKYYERELEGIQSTKITGRRDVRNHIILDNSSHVKNRYDGYSVVTTIDIKLQKAIESILSQYKEQLAAKEIMASVMDSKSGEIVSVASSRRFIHGHIEDADSLTISGVRYIFEPGSVMKPIIFSLLLQSNKIRLDDIVRTYNGEFMLGNKVIRDEHRYPYLSAENVIVHSSNIGIAQLAQKLDPLDYFQGLRDFGFGTRTKIDISYELAGSIPNIHRLKNYIFKATVSYGYGIKVNFFHLLQAYNVFNNDGLLIQPTIGKYIVSEDKKQILFHKKPKRVLNKDVVLKMKKVLVKTVNEGTGKGTITPGIEVGGKTGTAQIAYKGEYVERYNTSFFGFANDNKHRYTIGVTVIEPNPEGRTRFASFSAVPVYKAIIDTMIKRGLLKPN